MKKAYAALLTVLVTIAGLALVATPAAGRDLPERTLYERPLEGHQVSVKTTALKGRVMEAQPDGTELPYAKGKVLLQKRDCKACDWKPYKMLTTDKKGVYRSLIGVPFDGRWLWRVRVKASDGYATTIGKVWGTGYR